MSLIFLPGNHSLDTPLLVEHSESIRMEIMGNSSEDTKIECKYLTGFNLDIGNVTGLHISGLQFVGCRSSFHLTR